MSHYETIAYSHDQSVAVIAIDRPDSMNAFNKTLRLELTDALSDASNDSAIRAVILTGNGKAFSAGADLTAGFPEKMTIDAQLQREYRPAFNEIIRMPKPLIAAINGAAAGIGMSFALVADLAVMSDQAFMLSPFSTISLVPDGGASWLLQKQLGYKRAYQLAVEAERIDAARCLEWGLVNRVVPHDEVLSNAIAWGHTLSARAPRALKATKIAMRHAEGNDWASTFDIEASLQNDLVGSPDNVEGVQAFFDKRTPNFKG
ncbi:MAG: enoyl-CoA hydratase-related protein [Pseudomonadota bacterium]